MIPSVQNLSQESDFRDLSPWLWLWLPLIYLLINIIAAGIGHEFYETYIDGGELGSIELSSVLVLLIATVLGIHSLTIIRSLGDVRLGAWIFLGTLGCLYFGGEEASWGQHIFNWESSEAWLSFNDQQETNLHNSEKWGALLDQLPRNLLTLGILVGGIIAPLYRRYKNLHLNPTGINYWIWPTIVGLPAGIIAVSVSFPEKIYGSITGVRELPYFDISAGELKELYCGYFLMVYMWSFNLRMRQLKKGLAGK